MEYPYSTSTGSIIKILEKIQTVGQPTKVDKKWFSSIGFSKSSEQRMIAVLKFIGFVEPDGKPASYWTQFRSRLGGKKVLGKALKESYRELFDIYPNANELGKDELTHFFSTRTTAGSLVLSHTVNTFKNLTEFAEFENETTESIVEIEDNSPKDNKETKEKTVHSSNSPLTSQIQSKSGITVNINIQLTVPETTDEKVFDKFFESMKKHLLS